MLRASAALALVALAAVASAQLTVPQPITLTAASIMDDPFLAAFAEDAGAAEAADLQTLWASLPFSLPSLSFDALAKPCAMAARWMGVGGEEDSPEAAAADAVDAAFAGALSDLAAGDAAAWDDEAIDEAAAAESVASLARALAPFLDSAAALLGFGPAAPAGEFDAAAIDVVVEEASNGDDDDDAPWVVNAAPVPRRALSSSHRLDPSAAAFAALCVASAAAYLAAWGAWKRAVEGSPAKKGCGGERDGGDGSPFRPLLTSSNPAYGVAVDGAKYARVETAAA